MRWFLWRRNQDSELSEELQNHLRMAVQERVDRGEPRAEAEAAVRRQFGNELLVIESTRRQWGWIWLEQLGQDLRYGVRMLARSPGFTLVALLTLALGIGANTAMFSVTHAVMLRALPFSEPQRLVRIWESSDRLKQPFFAVSIPNLVSWKEEAHSFEEVSAWRVGGLNVQFGPEPERVPALWVTSSLFPMLGLKPVVGRFFRPDEERRGSTPVAIIGYDLWLRRFGGDPQVIGRSLQLPDHSCLIVGVAPQTTILVSQADVFLPLVVDAAGELRANKTTHVAARLKRDVSLSQARAEMDAIAARLSRQFPDSNKDWGIRILSFSDWVLDEDTKRALVLLQMAVIFVLLIACSNVASLLLSRTEARRKEIALRVALGSSGMRLLRQFLAESVLLATLGGVAGTALAAWGTAALRAMLPAGLPRTGDIHVNGSVLVFSTAITVMTALLFGLAPSIHAARSNQHARLSGADHDYRTKRAPITRRPLVLLQFVLATVLVACASLVFESFLNLYKTKLGFRPDHVLTAQLAIPGATYQARLASYQRLLNEMKTTPGVVSVALASILPFQGGNNSLPLSPVGSSAIWGEPIMADWRQVSQDYFQTLRIPLLKGRAFDDHDAQTDAPLVTVISEDLARRAWPASDAVGHELSDGQVKYTIVGVVGNVRNLALNLDPAPAVYFPRLTWPSYTLAVRTEGNPYDVVDGLREKMRQINPVLPVFGLRSLGELIDATSAQPRFNSMILILFAGIATILGAVGVYGVTGHAVSRRIKEIGVRIALGASRRSVLLMVVRDSMIPVVIGITLGIAAALAGGRIIARLLYGISPQDSRTLVNVVLALTLVAATACYVPAHRASRVDPICSLRHE